MSDEMFIINTKCGPLGLFNTFTWLSEILNVINKNTQQIIILINYMVI